MHKNHSSGQLPFVFVQEEEEQQQRRNLDTTWNKWSVNRILSGQFIVIDKNTNLPGTFVTSHKQSQDVVDCPPGINEDDDDDGPPPTRDDKR